MSAEREFDLALVRRRSEQAWSGTGVERECTAAHEGKEAYIREVVGEWEARVYRHPTGPEGPDPELAHGPQVFATAGGALDWCDAQLGFAAP